MRLHARAVALAALGRLEAAVKEKEAFEAAAAKVPEEFNVGNTPSKTILELAKHYLAGEVLFRQGQLEKAAAELKEAATIEDGIRYDEPPDWLIPARHALGAVLLAARKPLEAEAVYRDDLARNPENGWALFGLAKALRARGADAEAAQVDARFKKAWARADVTIAASCFCAAGG
jgi:tetratricopeptide (TPR) repeat protein